jgi:radical SAM protein with 4Fe4S-binding SPASM domain
VLNVSTLCGSSRSRSDSLRYGRNPGGQHSHTSAAERRPVVVWNLTRACNLACRHCYASARSRPDPDEMTTSEITRVLESLASYEVPALLLSGGEPTARPDFLDILETASALGLATTVSTNGTLIDAATAQRIAGAGVAYVGISLDGPPDLHDKLRGVRGAWQRSVEALDELGKTGVRRGIRFTLTPLTLGGLESVLQTVVRLGVERFCLYHLVPSGRGQRLRDVSVRQRLASLYQVFDFALKWPGIEVLTVANPSDSVALYRWLQQRDPKRAESARALMAWNGGALNGSGVALACIDEVGTVFPDQFSRHRPLGSVRTEPFPLLWDRWRKEQAGLFGGSPIPDKCKSCSYFDICGGGMRVRAEFHTGDPAGFDPSCLADAIRTEAA